MWPHKYKEQIKQYTTGYSRPQRRLNNEKNVLPNQT